MLAPLVLPADFHAWNQKHGSPSGRNIDPRLKAFTPDKEWRKMTGGFSPTPMTKTRTYEYPWIYSAIARPRPVQMVEIGGTEPGLSSILREEGHGVTTLEVRQKAKTPPSVQHGGQESLLDAAAYQALPSDHFEIFYAVSSLERLRTTELAFLLAETRRCLKPQGIFALTVSLFLNLKPFTRRDSNNYGSNLDIQKLVHQSGLELISGRNNELYGFPEFNAVAVLENLEHYLIGTYPVLKQCIILKKPAA